MKQYLQYSSYNTLSFLRFSNRVLFLPSLLVYPSNMCNFDCFMCSSGSSKIKIKEEMEFSLMKRVINECSKFLFKPLLHFSGYGEPLLYSRIKDTIEECNNKKIKWSMTTNAYLLDEFMEDIVVNNCNSMNVSIHGKAVQHDKITGVDGAFEKVYNSIIELDKLKKRYNKKTPFIAINCVINNFNVSRLKEILELFNNMPINSFTFQHLHFSPDDLNSNQGLNSQNLDKNNLHDLIDFLTYLENETLKIKAYTYPRIQKKDIAGYYCDMNYDFNTSCIYPWLSLEVYPNGDVQLCNQLLGNLNSYSLSSLINNDKALEFRKLVKEGKKDLLEKPPDCFRCPHRHY